MKVKTKSGRVLDDADIERIAAKAEAGFDLSSWKPRRGRPYLSPTATEHSPRIAVRVPAGLRDKAAMRAMAEGKNLSQVVRGLLEDYARGPAPRQSAQRSAPRGPAVSHTSRARVAR